MQAKLLAVPLIILAVMLTGCGQVLTRPTPLPTSTTTLDAILLGAPTRPPMATPIPLATDYSPADPPPTPAPTPTPIVYIVEPGDTLLGIAIRFGVTAEALRLVNPSLRPELLQIGQRVIVPGGEGGQEKSGLLPLPTPLPLSIVGLGFYKTPVGGMWCLGAVVNQTESAVENVRVAVTLYNADGSPLVTMDSWAARDVIPPGESAPFGVLYNPSDIPDPPADLNGHQVTVLSGERVTRPDAWYSGLLVAKHQGGPAGAIYRVTGTVQNSGEQAAERVTLLVTLYNAEGQVTGFRQETLPNPLPAGTQEQFDIRLCPGGPDTDHYTVVVSGRPADHQD